MEIYLDNAATTPIDPEVRAAMLPFLGEHFGNPSSRHPLGLRAARALEEARAALARAVGARPEDVVLTSGGTEANNLAVLGLARARKRHGRHLLLGPTEHPSVREAALALQAEGFEVGTMPLDALGGLDLERSAEALRPDTVLVALMLVNNEVGTIYPVARLARLARACAPAAWIHVDAIQALGKVPVTLAALGASSLAITAHKVHGPKGSGALVLAEGVRPVPLVLGGGQEHGLRSGTENVAGAVGLARAVTLAAETQVEGARSMARLRARLAQELAQRGGARVLDPGGPDAVSPAVAAVLLPGPPAEVWMHHLETRGVYTSAGSACQAKKRAVPPALLSLGLSAEEAARVLRFSFARHTRDEDLTYALEALREVESEVVAHR
jgi:cysteine desulfurase